jgi:hypothetical protein
MREAQGVLVDPVPPAAADADDWDWAAWDQADWEAAVEAMAAAGPWPACAPTDDDDSTDDDLAAAGGDAERCWPPPGLLEEVQPGPLLASLVAETDLSACSDGDLVGVVRAAYRMQAWAAAVEVEATNRLVVRCESWRGVVPEGQQVSSESVSAELMASVEIGAALDLAPQTARGRVAFARDLARLPATRVALAAGVLDVPKARLLVDELAPLPEEDAHAIEQRVVAAAAGRTRAQLAGRLRRAVLAVDPAAARRRQERARAERRVQVFPLDDGMAGLTYLDTAARVQALDLWLTGRATAATGPAGTDDRTLDQRRADVLGDVGVHGLASEDLPVRHGRRPQIQVTLAATTLLGLDEQPGELAGYGPITAPVARRIAADGTWRRLLTDPRTGRFDELSVDSYEPPQDLAEHVIARDRTCQHYGCRTPAARCDLDHRDPYPRGPTSAGNLAPRCRSHHQVKTHTDTSLTSDGHGGTHLTLPSGRRYHRPADPVQDDLFSDLPPF